MNHNLNRRTFLTTAASTLALPFVPLAGYAADVDVIIIGAGAAGLSAARYFMRKGISFRLLEVKNRTGGRALTDTHTFGKPFDWAAHSCIIATKILLLILLKSKNWQSIQFRQIAIRKSGSTNAKQALSNIVISTGVRNY